MTRSGICVLTSSFPRFRNDPKAASGAFIFEIHKNLTEKYDFHVVTHHLSDSEYFEEVDGITIHRFRHPLKIKKSLAASLSNPAFFVTIPYYLFLFYLKARSIIKNGNIRIVHAHWCIPGGLIARLLGKKYICTVHGSDIRLFHKVPVIKWIIRTILERAEAVITVGPELKRLIVQTGIQPQKVILLPQAIDLAPFRTAHGLDEIRRRYRLDKQPITLFIGNLVPIKAPDNVIMAVNQIKREIPGIRLLIIGDGPMRGQLEKMIRQLGLQRNIVFIGNVPHTEIPGFLVLADILMPSMKVEGISLVQLEAIAAGTPFIAKAPNDYPFVQKVAVQADVRDYRDVARKVLRFYRNREPIIREVRANREVALSQFSWKERSRRLDSIYQSVVNST